MKDCIFLTILFYLITSLASSTPAPVPAPAPALAPSPFSPEGDGYTAPLISPISPRSPFYPEILAANNFPPTLTNITLDRTHYEKWLETRRNMSRNDYSIARYNKNALYYVTELFIGKPKQLVYGIFDTGSDLIWVQCQNQPTGKGSKFPYFNQSRSHNYKVINCKNKKQCATNKRDLKCSPENSCLYYVEYDDGDASRGFMATDVITMKPNMRVIPNFVFGCSIENPLDVPGIIGASSSYYSLPKQLYPNNPKFSYCISGLTSKTNFVRFGNDAKLLGAPVRVLTNHRDPSMYFIDVAGMRVNGVDIKADWSVFELSRDGLTGFMIDSGYEYTALSNVAFDALKYSLYVNLGAPKQVKDFELCYQFKFGWRTIRKPVISIKFGMIGWEFHLDERNVWEKMGNTKLECLAFLRSDDKISVLGAHQLFNVNVGHDVQNNMLYLKPMNCPTSI